MKKAFELNRYEVFHKAQRAVFLSGICLKVTGKIAKEIVLSSGPSMVVGTVGRAALGPLGVPAIAVTAGVSGLTRATSELVKYQRKGIGALHESHIARHLDSVEKNDDASSRFANSANAVSNFFYNSSKFLNDITHGFSGFTFHGLELRTARSALGYDRAVESITKLIQNSSNADEKAQILEALKDTTPYNKKELYRDSSYLVEALQKSSNKELKELLRKAQLIQEVFKNNFKSEIDSYENYRKSSFRTSAIKLALAHGAIQVIKSPIKTLFWGELIKVGTEVAAKVGVVFANLIDFPKNKIEAADLLKTFNSQVSTPKPTQNSIDSIPKLDFPKESVLTTQTLEPTVLHSGVSLQIKEINSGIIGERVFRELIHVPNGKSLSEYLLEINFFGKDKNFFSTQGSAKIFYEKIILANIESENDQGLIPKALSLRFKNIIDKDPTQSFGKFWQENKADLSFLEKKDIYTNSAQNINPINEGGKLLKVEIPQADLTKVLHIDSDTVSNNLIFTADRRISSILDSTYNSLTLVQYDLVKNAGNASIKQLKNALDGSGISLEQFIKILSFSKGGVLDEDSLKPFVSVNIQDLTNQLLQQKKSGELFANIARYISANRFTDKILSDKLFENISFGEHGFYKDLLHAQLEYLPFDNQVKMEILQNTGKLLKIGDYFSIPDTERGQIFFKSITKSEQFDTLLEFARINQQGVGVSTDSQKIISAILGQDEGVKQINAIFTQMIKEHKLSINEFDNALANLKIGNYKPLDSIVAKIPETLDYRNQLSFDLKSPYSLLVNKMIDENPVKVLRNYARDLGLEVVVRDQIGLSNPQIPTNLHDTNLDVQNLFTGKLSISEFATKHYLAPLELIDANGQVASYSKIGHLQTHLDTETQRLLYGIEGEFLAPDDFLAKIGIRNVAKLIASKFNNSSDLSLSGGSDPILQAIKLIMGGENSLTGFKLYGNREFNAEYFLELLVATKTGKGLPRELLSSILNPANTEARTIPSTPLNILQSKLEQYLIANYFEHISDKKEIINVYSNIVNFGSIQGMPVVGFESAAQVFFGKTLDKLDTAQKIIIVGLLQSPGQYSPVIDPDVAKDRGLKCLSILFNNGVIKKDEVENLRQQISNLKFTNQIPNSLITQKLPTGSSDIVESFINGNHIGMFFDGKQYLASERLNPSWKSDLTMQSDLAKNATEWQIKSSIPTDSVLSLKAFSDGLAVRRNEAFSDFFKKFFKIEPKGIGFTISVEGKKFDIPSINGKPGIAFVSSSGETFDPSGVLTKVPILPASTFKQFVAGFLIHEGVDPTANIYAANEGRYALDGSVTMVKNLNASSNLPKSLAWGLEVSSNTIFQDALKRYLSQHPDGFEKFQNYCSKLGIVLTDQFGNVLTEPEAFSAIGSSYVPGMNNMVGALKVLGGNVDWTKSVDPEARAIGNSLKEVREIMLNIKYLHQGSSVIKTGTLGSESEIKGWVDAVGATLTDPNSSMMVYIMGNKQMNPTSTSAFAKSIIIQIKEKSQIIFQTERGNGLKMK